MSAYTPIVVMSKSEFIEVGKVSEISDGKMKHIEVDGKEVLIANVGGNFYAISDRCGHMNVLLLMGTLTGKTVTYSFHGAKYDVTNGKKLSEPILSPSQVVGSEMEPLPQTWQKFFENVGPLLPPIKTYDQIAYETRIDGDSIKIKL